MLWQEQIRSWIPAFAGTSFKPQSASGIRRLQFFWMGCLVLGVVGLFYGIMNFLSGKATPQKQEEIPKPTSIETAIQKVDLNEVSRHKVEDEMKSLTKEIFNLKEKLEGALHDQESPDQPSYSDSNDLEVSSSGPMNDPRKEDQRAQELETKILQLESELENQRQSVALSQPAGEAPKEQLISKFSLSLSEHSPQKRSHLMSPHLMRFETVDTTIPAGAFAKTILLSGLDASASMTASSDPRPMLLRLIDPGTLPRRFQSDLKDCHCLASAYGDLSSERVYARLEKLTCIERGTGEVIETQVAGYIAGSDGKAGIRGIVASKDGQFLGRSLVGGIFAGLSNVANPQNRQAQTNPFLQGDSHVSPPNVGEMFTSGMASGATTALDRLSQYYIDRAEQLQPVIQIAAGQVVDIVFTEGTFIGSQNVKADIKKTREDSQASSTFQQGD